MYYIFKTFQITRWCLRKIFNFLSFKNNYKQSWFFIKQFIDVSAMKPATGKLRKRQLEVLDFTKELTKILEENDITPILAYGSLLGAVRHKGYIPWDDDIDFDLIREDYEKLIKLAKEKYIFLKRPMNRYWSWDRILKFEDKLFQKYPNQLIFVQAYNHLQVYKGTNYTDFKLVDFFALDYYADDYDYNEHKSYLKRIKRRLESINNNVKEVDFLELERNSNPNIVKNSNKIFYAIDSDPAYTSAVYYGEWFTKDDLYPLKKIKFEDTEFLAPNNSEKFLEHRYNDWNALPSNLEFVKHFPIVENYLKKHYPNK